jgi:hypothetical protein
MRCSLLKMRKKWHARIDGWVIFTPLARFYGYFNNPGFKLSIPQVCLLLCTLFKFRFKKVAI